jgi:hypothetical protein
LRIVSAATRLTRLACANTQTRREHAQQIDRFTGMEELEVRQLLSGTLFKVDMSLGSGSRDGAAQMLTLQDGVQDPVDPTFWTASEYKEKPDGMSIDDFIKSLVTGTITGTVIVGDPPAQAPVAFDFQTASTVYGDSPIWLNGIGGDDANGYSGFVAVDDYFNYESPEGHSYGNNEWSFNFTPAGRVSVEAVDDQASEDAQDQAQFLITPNGNCGSYAYFTLGGSAIFGGTDPANLTTPDADYTISGDVTEISPGVYKTPFGWYGASVSVVPVNDSAVEGAEDVQLTLVADPESQGHCPAYADPAGNAATQPSTASSVVSDLRVTSNIQLIPYDTLDEIIERTGSDNWDQRQQASLELTTFLTQYPYPAVEDHATAKAAATNNEETISRVNVALNTAATRPRLSIYGNGPSYSFVPANTGPNEQFQIEVTAPYTPVLTVKQSGAIAIGSGATVDLIPTYAGIGTVTITVRRMQLIHDDNTGADIWTLETGTDYSISFEVVTAVPA